MAGEILGFLVIFLLGWLGIGSGLIYVIHIFQFQIPFSQALRRAGVYDLATHRKLLSTKWIGAAVTLGGSTALAVWLGLRSGYMGLVMGLLGCFVGMLRGRHLLQNRQGNVVRFVRTHLVCMNREALAAHLKQTYALELTQLLPPQR